MSMSIVHHVREKSQAKGSARTLLLDLAVYTNYCCGVAWPSDTTLYHDCNVSRQRIHELKNILEEAGELVIVERPGATNLYFVAWQGQPLGGTSRDTGRHDPQCPLRNPDLAASRTHLEGSHHRPTCDVEEGLEISDPPEGQTLDADREGSDPPDSPESEISDGRGQKFLTQKTRENHFENTGAPAMIITPRPQIRPPNIPPKAEHASPFWCPACKVAIPTCQHRVVYGTARGSLRRGSIAH